MYLTVNKNGYIHNFPSFIIENTKILWLLITYKLTYHDRIINCLARATDLSRQFIIAIGAFRNRTGIDLCGHLASSNRNRYRDVEPLLHHWNETIIISKTYRGMCRLSCFRIFEDAREEKDSVSIMWRTKKVTKVIVRDRNTHVCSC